MYCSIEDFAAQWKTEESATLKIFESVSDEVLNKKVNDDLRSLGRLAWHITQTLTEMPHKAGLVDEDKLENMPIPESMREIINTYKQCSALLLGEVEKRWKDDDLTGTIEVYGEQWERRKVLSVLVMHQAHHRGQMTALMRMHGLKVPGIYGPAKEEWSKYSMPAME
jgi:uncharacterized damage-inducible protein DinB